MAVEAISCPPMSVAWQPSAQCRAVVAQRTATRTRSRAFEFFLLLVLPALALAQDQHAAIQSTRGVQHKPPLISDDIIVGCIMIMFLLLFAFGARTRFLCRTQLPTCLKAGPELPSAAVCLYPHPQVNSEKERGAARSIGYLAARHTLCCVCTVDVGPTKLSVISPKIIHANTRLTREPSERARLRAGL